MGNHKACRPVGCSPTAVLCVHIPHTHILLAVSVPAWLLHVCNSTAPKSCSTSPLSLGFPGGSDRKESTCSAGDLGSIPGLGRSPGGRHGNPLQYSCLESPSWTEEPGVTKSQTRLSTAQLWELSGLSPCLCFYISLHTPTFTLSLVCLFHLWSSNPAYNVTSHRMMSPAQASPVRPDSCSKGI